MGNNFSSHSLKNPRNSKYFGKYRYQERQSFYRTEMLEILPEEMEKIRSIKNEPVKLVNTPIPDEPVLMIIDTDIGTDLDDSLAILYALRLPNVEILGITTNYGVPILRSEITQKICNLHFKCRPSAKRFPIVAGAASSIGTHRELFLFGNEGAGLFTKDQIKSFVQENIDKIDDKTQTKAANFIIDKVCSNPHKVKLVSIGIPTNIALALKIEPKIAALINEIIVMGGGSIVYNKKKQETPFEHPIIGSMPDFVLNGNIVHIYPNHNLSGDTMASKIMFDFPNLKIRIIPHDITSKFWLSGAAIEHLKKLSAELEDETLETKYRDPQLPSQVVGINLAEWFKRRNGNGGGQCPHDPLTVHEAAFGDDLASVRYAPGTFVCHEWAAFGTFVPHLDGNHFMGVQAIDPQDFLNQLTSVLIEKD